MIYDAFPFLNEFEILELRCEELRGVVDQHFLIESPTTFQGTSKPLYFTEKQKLFSKYPITPIVVDLPDWGYFDPWRNGTACRVLGYKEVINQIDPNAWLFLSDVDEIPKASKLLEYPEKDAVVFLMKCFTYWLDYQSPEVWKGTIRMKAGKVKEMGGMEAFWYRHRGAFPIPDAGWHFSYQGGIKRIQEKLGAYEHSEYSTPFYTNSDRIKQKMADGSDLFDRAKEGFIKVPIDSTYPKYLVENQKKFSHMISPE